MARSAAGAAGAHPSAHPLAWALMLLRVFVGLKFLEAGIQHWSWMGTDHLRVTLTKWITGDAPAAYSSYIPFLTKFVVPHAPAFTYLFVSGEIVVGILFVLGLATRLASLPALMLSMNYMLATWNLGYEWQGINEAFIAMELAVLLTGAGRYGGLDTPLAKRHPKWPIW